MTRYRGFLKEDNRILKGYEFNGMKAIHNRAMAIYCFSVIGVHLLLVKINHVT